MSIKRIAMRFGSRNRDQPEPGGPQWPGPRHKPQKAAYPLPQLRIAGFWRKANHHGPCNIPAFLVEAPMERPHGFLGGS
jgi:hypothetical protein